jgi:putative nucleotidyltransferase with HDIG domain
MSEISEPWNPTRKSILNFVFFLSSIIIVTALWPHDKEDNVLQYFGSLIIVSSGYLVLFLFLSHFRAEVLLVIRKTLFIILSILSFVLLTRFVRLYPDMNLIYLIPFAIIPVVIRTFYDARLALFILLITLMLAGFMVSEPFEFVFMNFISGMASIFTLTNIFRRGRLFFTSLLVILSYSVLYTALHLIGEGDVGQLNLTDYLFFSVNGILVLFSYPIIFLFEQKFLFLSDTTLLELSDINQPLLRKLAVEAPGSFQHSLQVANLAEEAARVTGANLLLVRAGSLYHDIGKVASPHFYNENQTDAASPHDLLDPMESGKVIINHVRNGVTLAKNFKIPIQIIDFIRTHHGTTVAYYFYRKYTEQKPWDTAREAEFKYPGPKPFSKETAIVMMADAVEASSRSIESYTEQNISEMVERIIYLQEHDGQFTDVPLTYKDISDIKSAFKKRLSTIYHVRIAYPERDQTTL